MSTERRRAMAVERVDPRWDAARVEASLSALHRKRARRRAGVAASAIVMLVAIVGVGARLATDPPTSIATTAVPDRIVHLADGSIVAPEEGGQVVVEHVSDGRVAIRVEHGAASVDVTRRPDRVFVVTVGEVVVTVLGTAFRVERLTDGHARVSVTRGHVDVAWQGGHADLFAGDDGVFPRTVVAAAPAPSEVVAIAEAETEANAETEAVSAPPTREPTPARAATTATSGWRDLARASRYDEAYVAMDTPAERIEPATASADDLWLAADVARLSGHAAEATTYLQALERDHASDPRATLASLSRGRLLANLGRSREAADEYEHYLDVDPGGSFAEDALAHAALAREDAGDHTRASVLAERYARAYPGGRWSSRVRAIEEVSPPR